MTDNSILAILQEWKFSKARIEQKFKESEQVLNQEFEIKNPQLKASALKNPGKKRVAQKQAECLKAMQPDLSNLQQKASFIPMVFAVLSFEKLEQAQPAPNTPAPSAPVSTVVRR